MPDIMENSEMTDQYFKTDAKQMVDMLFDKKLFIDTLTRDDLNGVEELLQYLLQSKFDSYLKAEKLFSKMKLP